ncbi:MAG: hypothetical protein ACXV8O_01305 [Methylobacter sp.]
MAEDRDINWNAIELDYRAGQLTLRVIAEKYGITHGAINKRAKRDGWERDLSGKIKQRAEALVSKIEVSKAVSNEKRILEKDIIETNATMQANIILSHRSNITRYRNLCEALLSELEIQTGECITFEELGEMMHSPDDKGMDKLNELYRKVISTPSRVDSTKKLSETLKTLIGLERQAFGLADNSNGDADKDKSKPTEMDDKTLAAKMAGLFALAEARANK